MSRDQVRREQNVSVENRKKTPVGVFDSGVGGLTVAREIARQLPNENIVYFGDTARVPYGSKSQNTIIRFSEQIIRFLKTKQVKAIVIACNTASALALDAVRDEFGIPIIGVVIPGARAAVEATKNRKIGVVGTDATVQSGMYTKIIQGMAPDVTVIEKACPLFVPLVEEGFKEHVVTQEVIEYYLESMRSTDIDAMILGCTHYPLLRSKIREYMGEEIQIVNPAYETAMDLKRILHEQDMENDGATEEHSRYSFYVSDAAEKFRRFANTVMPFDVPTTNVVNIEEY
ncbi:MAG TPA: glutamate racemase [Candidatus Mediterraneibacter merdavium]|nr:glutamate racemase [Candidatus Mediterraneibacter merdavium]